MHSLEAGSAWKHDSIYPCPVPHQYGPVPYWCMVILLNALLASCFVEQTLLIKAHCFISQGLSEAPAIPLSLVLQTSFICPQTFWATFLFFSSCRKAESDIVQLHFSPQPLQYFYGLSLHLSHTISCLWQASKMTIVFQRKSISMAFLGVA